MKFLTDEENSKVEAAIKKAEEGTSGEIVFTIADASANYQHATLQGALIGMVIATAVYLVIPVSHTVTHLLWTEFIAFAVFYTFLPRLPWRRWIISKQEMELRVQEEALMQFYASGLYKTQDSNGVEIFLSLLEKRVVVIGDKAIHEKMGDQYWQQIRDLIILGIKEGDICGGICNAVGACGQALARHFPPKPDDTNELPNRVIKRNLDRNAP
jgi:putative membrane protein